jgi:hypothetical protein
MDIAFDAPVHNNAGGLQSIRRPAVNTSTDDALHSQLD